MHKFTVFDFLKDLVSNVPDVGGSDADPDDKASKKRFSDVDIQLVFHVLCFCRIF